MQETGRFFIVKPSNLTGRGVTVPLQVAMVFHYNAVDVNPAVGDGDAGTPPPLGSGLYPTACRANHSCSPNCFWYATSDGSRAVTAMVPVAAGEELTIDYFLETMDVSPVRDRRACLLGMDILNTDICLLEKKSK